ncbi:PTS sugar transporter subunit IIA [Escherichia coli]|uniref:PTS sugar transporter subunit IIA n=1 Tax=Escherichia coli TaxID=562 RepID=UPI001C9B6ADA|nr:PTS sugar transporter subunit IIA [Escherichia coli]MBY7427108.1 PTS sugar transporter subunit IIA [Escherichia coli]MBY7529386.1 PTS sugar transporter subunit IIA [Escherichia coli]MBY7615015.1 PTS sugar transporter subunit IIA [Escherichia coli]MBY7624116.1 PTS sugar transporter subunit IIA [Escherichia coli]
MKLRDSLAENKSIRLQAEAETWQDAVKIGVDLLVTLKKPLEFNHEDNDPVDILITMAAVDANTHQEVGIMQIVNLFEDEENFDRLRACRTEQEVLDLIDRTNAAA